MKPVRVITISRQYGSGGREIGQLLAKQLGFSYYDQKLIERTAEESGISKKFIERDDEQVKHSMRSWFSIGQTVTNEVQALPTSDRIFLAQVDVIRAVADEAPCIIIGRCADYILSERDDTLSVYLYSDMESRLKRVAERNGLDEREAAARLKKKSKSRENYYQSYTGRRAGASENYDMCLATNILGIEGTVGLLTDLIKRIGIEYA